MILIFVTKVVLSNALLDIAFYDRIKKNPNYIYKFWIGLMDGNRSIQVNYWRYKKLQYRLVIKLNYCFENLSMLNLIAFYIEDKIKIIEDKKFVIWFVINRKQILQILKKYPSLTTKLKAQLKFMLDCFEQDNVVWYLNARNKKYLMLKFQILIIFILMNGYLAL